MLAEAISHAYGLAVTSITPMPGGYAATCFDVRSPAGRFVAKVWRKKPPGAAWLAFPWVPETLRTRDGERIVAGPLGPMCLLPYVPGATPPDWPRWPPPVLRSLGEFLAAVHATTPPPGLPVDDLAAPAPDLSKVDADLVVPLRTQLARLDNLRDAIHFVPEAMVLCHTDVGGDNILVGPDGRLTLLDWDEAAITFPEADFVLIARDQPASGEPLRLVLQGYRRPLRLDRLAYLMLRRYIGDALARVDRLLDPSATEAQRREARAGIAEWGIRQWNRLDEALEACLAAGATL